MTSTSLAFAAVVFFVLLVAAYLIGLWDGCRLEQKRQKRIAIRTAVRSQLDPAYHPESWKG